MKQNRVFTGSLLILGAVSLLLNKLGYFHDINFFSVLVTIFLVSIAIKSLFKMNFTGILFPIAFICIIYDTQLGIEAITPWTVLIAAFLGSLGLSMIFNKKPHWSYNKYSLDSYEFETIDIEDENNIRLHTSFAGSVKYINTDKFERADLDCSFGSMKVYFDNAKLNNGRGIIKLDASFSGVELFIPKSWTVENRMGVSFGGVEEKNKNMGMGDNILTLVGNVSFSGVEITYV